MPVKYDKRRTRVEIMFGRLKDCRRVATRYGRCATVSGHDRVEFVHAA